MLSSPVKAETSFHSDQLQTEQAGRNGWTIIPFSFSFFFFFPPVIVVHFPAQGWDSLWGRWYDIVCFVNNFLSKMCLKEIIVTFWGLPCAEASIQSVVSHEQTGKKRKITFPQGNDINSLKFVLTVNVVLSHIFANTPIN